MDSVRFRQVGRFSVCEGLVHCDGFRLRLEYQVADGVLGVIKSQIREATVALADLASVELAGGWVWGYRIVLQAESMEAVRDVPGMSQGRVELLIDRGDREAARRLVDALRKPTRADDGGLDA